MSRPSLVIFAAGRGTRLRPLTYLTPKAMVPILDVPMIDLALGRGASVQWGARFVNVSGPAPVLPDHLRGRHPEVEIFDEGEGPIGQAATLRCLLPRLSDPVMTYNCDLMSDLDLRGLLRHHAGAGKRCSLAVQAVGNRADLAVADGKVRLVDRRIEDRGGFLFLGTACFNRDLLEAIPRSQPLGLVEGLLRRAIEEEQVAMFEHRGYVCDAGTPGRYLDSSLTALNSIELPVSPPGMVSREGWYLGPGATADRASLGRGAIVLAGAAVGEGAVLENCIAWPGSQVPPGAHLSEGIWFLDRWIPVNRDD